MKFSNLLALLSLIFNTAVAQKTISNEYTNIDKKALALPDSLTKNTAQIAQYIQQNFSTDQDKSRAIFIWVATHIEFDVDNMFALNFYEQKEDKIAKSLATKKGICENYALIFSDICQKSGLKSIVVEGYTKQNGFADYIPHAWSAVQLDTSWYLFDPTWGSGYVSEKRFYKKINNNYYKVAPTAMIKTHMPFDYLYQFLNYPVTNQEFYEGKTVQNKSKSYFSYKDSLQVFEQQDSLTQLITSAYRVEKNGVKNSLIFDRLQHLKIAIENHKQATMVNNYNAAVYHYNEAIKTLNAFINYRNNQFSPKKTDLEIQLMLDEPKTQVQTAKSKLAETISNNEQNKVMIQQLSHSIGELSAQINEQEDWLKQYLGKSKIGRKSMFYKVTWMGIPIN